MTFLPLILDIYILKIPIGKYSNWIWLLFFLFRFQYPEIVFPDESPNNNRSISMVGFDVIDDHCSTMSSINSIPNSRTMSNIGGECNDLGFLKTEGSTVLPPVESVTLPIECKDLLNRLLEYKPERRIRSIFGLQRIAFFMNFNFDDVRKMKVKKYYVLLAARCSDFKKTDLILSFFVPQICPLDLMDSTEIYWKPFTLIPRNPSDINSNFVPISFQ